MSREGALWIGGLESYMDEAFIQSALEQMGETNVISIKVMKNKFTNEPASYGFINFDSDHNALIAMHKLNGKVVPNTNPPVRFKLNHQSTRLMAGEKDHSIWVGDLTPEVDDLQLYKFFAARFDTVRTAKVVLDNAGFSKGYGFIRFGCEKEQQTALASMMGASGLGMKPIRVSIAVAKGKSGGIPSSIVEPSTASAIASMVTGGNQAAASAAAAAAAAMQNPQGAQDGSDYSSQYWQYYQNWSQYAAWSQYSQQYPGYASGYEGYDQAATDQSGADPYAGYAQEGANGASIEDDEFELVEHSDPIDVELSNKKFLAKTEEFWDGLEASGWWQYEEGEKEEICNGKK